VTAWWRSHSVRVRLTIWYVGAMVVVLGVYAFAVYAFVGRSVSESLDEQLRNDLFWVVSSLYQTPDGDFMLNEPEQLDPEERLPWVQVWSADGAALLFRNGEALRRPVPESQAIASEGIVSITTETAPMRILTRRQRFEMRRGAVSDADVIIQVARSEETTLAQLRELALILALGLPVAIAVAGLGGYVLARRALAPIERMTEHARTITAERLSARIPVHNAEDEMGRLAAVFNETLARLEESFEQMRRFTTDVSHELRTPLTAIRSVGEVGLRGHRDDAAYRGIIGSMLEEADRLATLVDRLLTLSRAETRQARPAIEPVDLVELAEDVAGHLGVLAEEKGQSIVIEAAEPPAALADRLAVRQAMINLVDNAIKFAPPGDRIRIRIDALGGQAIVDVVDCGPGIPADARARIFDRFYRVDGVEAGGTGLGLSIARGAIESSGGHLTLEQSDAGGSTFRITLPKAAEPRRTGAPHLPQAMRA
jgi:heavy metal sensor kinase